MSVLRIRWPKYWSFSFSISPSSVYSGLISFRMDWFDHQTLKLRTTETSQSSEIHSDGTVTTAVPGMLIEHSVVLDNSIILSKMFKPWGHSAGVLDL